MAPSTTSTSISTFLKSQCEWGSSSYSWDGFGILPPLFWCQSAVLNGYDTSSTLSHSASCGEDQRCKCSMLDVQNSPWLETLFLVLMDTINLLWLLVPIRYSIRVTDPRLRCSPEMSWRTGLISTSLRTRLRNSAAISLSLLWRWVMKLPSLQIIKWLTVKAFPQAHAEAISSTGQS